MGAAKLYRITRSTSEYVWLRWAALGDRPPRGMSRRVAHKEFVTEWEQVTTELWGRKQKRAI